MTEKEEQELLIEVRKLFSTEKMYQEFLLHRKMNDEEREEFVKRDQKWFNTLSPFERKNHIDDLCTGFKLTSEYYVEIHLKELLGNIPEYLSFSKISKEYFGKSSSWLYHRLKGTLINGKPVKLSEEQRLKLADAFDDIAKEINQASATLRSGRFDSPVQQAT